jgi:hypothetical protein
MLLNVPSRNIDFRFFVLRTSMFQYALHFFVNNSPLLALVAMLQSPSKVRSSLGRADVVFTEGVNAMVSC